MNKFRIKLASLCFSVLTTFCCTGFILPSVDLSYADSVCTKIYENEEEKASEKRILISEPLTNNGIAKGDNSTFGNEIEDSTVLNEGSGFSYEYDEGETNAESSEKKKYIKWVDFNANDRVLKKVYSYAVKLNNDGIDFSFSEAMAYLASKNGNKFSEKKDLANLEKLIGRIKSGETISQICEKDKYFNYYKESFGAIFDGLIGKYRTEIGGDVSYGVCGYFPLARGHWYSHYDDFGSSRSYGFKRKHLGHDIMGSVGAPIIAVEGGTITELGWNRYGGWRIGIRSFDSKRYYYYAHLRKGKPYPTGLEIGKRIDAGQVIGFLGNTGYSIKEDVNLKTGKPHLHFGMQLIFDESQVKGNNEIWIDVYGICSFLSPYRAKVTKDSETGELKSTSIKYRDLDDFLG